MDACASRMQWHSLTSIVVCACVAFDGWLYSSTAVGKVAADDVPTLFKLASFCFFVNFDCQIFSRIYERELSTTKDHPVGDRDGDIAIPSTRERWQRIALEFLDNGVGGLENATTREGHFHDGSGRAFAFAFFCASTQTHFL